MSKIPIDAIISAATKVISDDGVKKTVLGTYSDGTPRSICDCFNGELLSPKDKGDIIYGKKLKKKNKKKKKNNFGDEA